MERFWNKVEKTNTCWNWKASGRGSGYGSFKYKGIVYDSHRFVWFLTYKEFPKEWILHKCNNRKCVNPNHLYKGTPRENYWDGRLSGSIAPPTRRFTDQQRLERKRARTRKWYEEIKNEKGRFRYKRWRRTQKRKYQFP